MINIGAIIVGVSMFIGANVALGGMPILGVFIGLVGGVIAGVSIADSNNKQ